MIIWSADGRVLCLCRCKQTPNCLVTIATSVSGVKLLWCEVWGPTIPMVVVVGSFHCKAVPRAPPDPGALSLPYNQYNTARSPEFSEKIKLSRAVLILALFNEEIALMFSWECIVSEQGFSWLGLSSSARSLRCVQRYRVRREETCIYKRFNNAFNRI